MSEFPVKELKHSPLFRGITEDELTAMLDCLSGSIRHYKKDASIFRWGDRISQIGLILKGNVHIVRESYWGKESLLARLGPGDLFGETYACVPQATFDGTALAAADTEILFLDLKRVLTTCSSACRFHTKLIQNLLGVLAEKNLHFSRKIDCLTPHTIRAKLLEYFSQQMRLQSSKKFTIPFNRQQLADYLSVDRSSMTVELYKMKDEGLIDFDKNNFTVC